MSIVTNTKYVSLNVERTIPNDFTAPCQILPIIDTDCTLSSRHCINQFAYILRRECKL